LVTHSILSYPFLTHHCASTDISTLSLHDALPILTITDLVKSLSHMPRVAYSVGSAVQLLPQGRDTLGSVRYANHLRAHSPRQHRDRKSTRLNSSHVSISYAVFCLKKKTREQETLS